MEDDGDIQAFLPFDLGPQRIGMPIGDPMNNLQGFVSEDATIDAKQVIRKAGLRGWRYTAAPAAQRALAAHHYDGTLVEAPLIDLSDGYEPYFASRSKKFTADFGKQWRSLERRVGPASLEWGSTAPEHIRQLIDWKSAKYGGTRELFAEPAARSILEELSVSSSEDCGGVVTVLRAGDHGARRQFRPDLPRCPQRVVHGSRPRDEEVLAWQADPARDRRGGRATGYHAVRTWRRPGRLQEPAKQRLIPGRRRCCLGDPRRARGARAVPGGST